MSRLQTAGKIVGVIVGCVGLLGLWSVWYTKRARAEKAEEHIRAAWDLLSENGVWLHELPTVAAHAKRREDARRRLEDARSLDSSNERADYVTVFYHLAERETDRAVRAACAAVEKSRGWAPAYDALGRALSYHQDSCWALCAFQKAVELEEADPESDCYHYNLGTLLYQAGEHLEAAAALRQAIEDGQDGADTRFNLALALEASSDLPAAITEYEAAVERDPTLREAYLYKAELQERLWKWDEARLTRARMEELLGDSEPRADEESTANAPPIVSVAVPCLQPLDCCQMEGS